MVSAWCHKAEKIYIQSMKLWIFINSISGSVQNKISGLISVSDFVSNFHWKPCSSVKKCKQGLIFAFQHVTVVLISGWLGCKKSFVFLSSIFHPISTYRMDWHSMFLVFPTQTKISMDFFTFTLQVYIRQIRISWKNHLRSGFQNSNPQNTNLLY